MNKLDGSMREGKNSNKDWSEDRSEWNVKGGHAVSRKETETKAGRADDSRKEESRKKQRQTDVRGFY